MTNGDRTRYIEIDVRSALNRVDSYRLPGLKWSLNPYRGCRHGCVYCYARYTHTFLELDPDADFTGTVFVKRNLVQALREDLRRPGWRREHVSIGTATDPYQPIEGRYRLTRGALEVLYEQLTPASLVTKNTMAVRDAEIMAALAQRAGFRLIMSITTLDEALARRLEPDVPGPQQRLAAVRALAQAGVPVAVAVAPILPGLNDDVAGLKAVIEAAYDHGADIAFHQVLRLYDATRPTFFRYLETERPDLLPLYRRTYGAGREATPSYREAIAARIAALERRWRPRQSEKRLSETTAGQLAFEW
ncbi:MAG: radical SAM protein [Anaerolineae bacterium]|nr:radical SAM protein [Caldilineales bacterium]MDW8268521.1 radical SAM protein [Anaerolineae bacterium]